MKFSYPVQSNFVIVQRFGENPQDYIPIGMKSHNGWDFSCPIGTPVYATHDGTVWTTSTQADGGLEIAIDTLDGQLRTFYAHMSSFSVAGGQSVKKGDLIGLSGNSGKYTTGPHCHFGVHHISNFSDVEPNNGWNGACDPAPYIRGLTRNLFFGCQGEDVRALQYFLKSKGYLTIPQITMYFGSLTLKAVMAYQKANNISPLLGYCGDKTRQLINNSI